MKALTIRQPWAHLIASGIKDIELRSWKTNYRGKIYIHSSAKSDHGKTPASEFLDYYRKHIPQEMKTQLDNGEYHLAAIIGEVELVDCVENHPSVWADEDSWNWVLANPVLYDKPILGVKGGLSLWNYEPVV